VVLAAVMVIGLCKVNKRKESMKKMQGESNADGARPQQAQSTFCERIPAHCCASVLKHETDLRSHFLGKLF